MTQAGIDERMLIAAFWRRLRESRPRLVGDIDRAAIEGLLAALHRIDPRLHFHLGPSSGGFDLVLSAEGHADLLPVLERIEAGAPKKPGCGIVRALDADLALGRRNPSRFPRNATGDALFVLASGGDDLCGERELGFSVGFDTQKKRDGCLRKLVAQGLAGLATRTDGLVVKQRMAATHAAITSFEATLAAVFTPFAGRSEGWGVA